MDTKTSLELMCTQQTPSFQQGARETAEFYFKEAHKYTHETRGRHAAIEDVVALLVFDMQQVIEAGGFNRYPMHERSYYEQPAYQRTKEEQLQTLDQRIADFVTQRQQLLDDMENEEVERLLAEEQQRADDAMQEWEAEKLGMEEDLDDEGDLPLLTVEVQPVEELTDEQKAARVAPEVRIAASGLGDELKVVCKCPCGCGREAHTDECSHTSDNYTGDYR